MVGGETQESRNTNLKIYHNGLFKEVITRKKQQWQPNYNFDYKNSCGVFREEFVFLIS